MLPATTGIAVQIAFKYIFCALGIYLGYCLLLFAMQRHMIFPRYLIDTPSNTAGPGSGIARIWLDTGSERVESWFIPPGNTQSGRPFPVAIFAHGNGELIDWWPEELSAFTRLGVGILLVEYPGYGRSTGSPSEASITRTFISAYDTVTARSDVDASRTVLFGRSMGGGAVCALSRKRPSAALILMSAFTSVRDFSRRYLVPGFLVRDPFDNLSAVAGYPGPILILHGRYDEVIPYRHGVALAKAARNARFLSYDCGHNDFPPGWYGFDRTLARFLSEAGLIRSDQRNDPKETRQP